ncbi:MAG: DUF1577 domain-containing protein [Spirochaetia bacterium]|nr:DUF1577 domain-containing protein [Spirochaetia bacterium]
MKLIHEKETRKFQTLTDDARKMHMIEKYFINKPYFLKNDNTGGFITGIKLEEKSRVIVDTKLKVSNEITMYSLFKKYIEFHGTVEETVSPERYRIHIQAVNVAVDERKHIRKLVDFNVVSIGNLRVSRNVINASLFNIPTSVKVHLKQYQQMLTKHADEVIVDVFDKTKEKHEIVRKTCKILYIKNTGDEKSYESDDPEKFINYFKSTDSELTDLMREYKDKKIVSEMIVPIIYTGHDGIPIPLGYIQLISKTKPIDIGQADVLLKTGAEIVQKMRDSNTVMINERQKIVNISNEGMCIKIEHEELKRLMPEQNGLTFDVIFKLTQPVTVSSEIIYLAKDNDDLIIGIKIIGFSTKSSDSTRYHSMVELLPG